MHSASFGSKLARESGQIAAARPLREQARSYTPTLGALLDRGDGA